MDRVAEDVTDLVCVTVRTSDVVAVLVLNALIDGTGVAVSVCLDVFDILGEPVPVLE